MNKIEYAYGFINDEIQIRNNISFIIKQNSLLKKNESFSIEANSSIDIIFTNPITTLESFFNGNYDLYSGSISYVDLSHFDASLVTRTYQMFKDCISLKEINFTNFQTSSIKMMAQMFSDCGQLVSLDLSNFDTSSVTNMGEIFRGCSSLAYLDISSFDTRNLKSFPDMFKNANNIKYISVYNATNYSALTEAISKYSNLNRKSNLTVCQKENIINNENALFACCDYWNYNFETLRCGPDNSTEMQIQDFIDFPDDFSFFQVNQTQNEFNPEIIIETTIVQKHVVSTLIEKIDLPKIESALAALLGFSHFIMKQSFFNFYIHLILTENNIDSSSFNIPLSITYDNNLRMLKEVDANCTLKNINNGNNYEYLCEVYGDTANIKQISINPDFSFLGNIKITGITPLAKMNMNNLQLVGDKYDMLSNSNIYVFDNSTCILYNELLFNISGVIDGIQPEIKNDNINLMINLQSEETTQTEVDCIIKNIVKNNYELSCKSKEVFEIELQSSISFMDSNNILLINFANASDSIMNKETKTNKSKINYKRLILRNQTGGLKPGIIAAIVLILIVIFVLTIFLVLYFRKQSKIAKNNSENSSVRNLNNHMK